MSAAGSDSGSLPGPIRRRRRRRARGMTPARNWARVQDFMNEIHDDEKLVQDLLLQEKILMVQGTGFNWPNHDHLRIVTLPWARDLAVAIERFGNFLSSYKQ